jgi:hypothetical protein
MSQPVNDASSVTGEPVVDNTAPQTEPKNEPNTSSTLSHEDALKELAKVRAEAADRRVKNRELEDQAKKWREYEESQKTELQKLQDAVAERDKRLADRELEVTRAKIARQFNVADDDLDLLVGDEENMKRLAERLGKPKDSDAPRRPVDLLAGNRGTAVTGKSSSFSMDEFIRGSAKR